jgi:hypothetical protein
MSGPTRGQDERQWPPIRETPLWEALVTRTPRARAFPQNEALAANWFRKAANPGDAGAQSMGPTTFSGYAT